jgi:hypothetical protein
MGTVTDVNGDATGATVVLTGPESADRRTAETGENAFDRVKPGGPVRSPSTQTVFQNGDRPLSPSTLSSSSSSMGSSFALQRSSHQCK